MVDLIELDGAEDYGRCTGCNGRWKKLPDETWLLAQGGAKSMMPNGPTIGRLPERPGESGPRYVRVERHADPRKHLEGHALAAWRAANPLADALVPVIGPSVEAMMRIATANGLCAYLDPAGEARFGRLASSLPNVERATVPPAESVGRGAHGDLALFFALLPGYRPLIRATLGGPPAVCVTAGCDRQAAHVDPGVGPICRAHAEAVVREAMAPPKKLPIEMPTPTPVVRPTKMSGAQWLAIERGPYGLRRQR